MDQEEKKKGRLNRGVSAGKKTPTGKPTDPHEAWEREPSEPPTREAEGRPAGPSAVFRTRAERAEGRLGATEDEETDVKERIAMEEAEKAEVKAAAGAILARYTVVSGDTLGGIALKFYNSAAREKWMQIYEANKGVIGDNPGMIKPGQELVIPRLII